MNVLNLFRDEKEDISLAAGDMIFEAGSEGDLMYVIRDGKVDVFIEDKAVMTLSSGDLLGEMALVDDQPRSATAIAKTDCRIVPVDEKRFNFLVQQAPTFALLVMRTLVSRLRRMNQAISI